MIKQVKVSAPGKLMLLGEHAVVYGHPCLVTAVDQRMRATVDVIDEPIFELHAPDVHITNYKKPMRAIGIGEIPRGVKFVEIAVVNLLSHPELVSGSRAKVRFRNKFGMTKEMGIRVTTKSEFSSQFGFGSSAASTVCAIKALSEIFALNLSQKEIFDISYNTILDIQGKGSGFDVAAAVYGGTLYFFTGGKRIEFLGVSSIPVIVGYSGVKADTVNLINKVKEKFVGKEDKLNAIYSEIGVLVEKAKESLIKKDWKTLGELMNINQKLLRELGVSISKLDDMIKAALENGAYGAKVSGAGGGDCMIALVGGEDRKKVVEAISKVGGEIIDVETNAEGVRIE